MLHAIAWVLRLIFEFLIFIVWDRGFIALANYSSSPKSKDSCRSPTASMTGGRPRQ
jgi:hypothetical protein